MDWITLDDAVRECTQCRLCQSRRNTVLGEGNPRASTLWVGEGPGAAEDQQGRPFVGPAGQLLDRMLASINLTREDIYITNVVKCRPPGNRNPTEEERTACMPYLRSQTRLIRPKMIVCMGTVAAQAIIGPDARITRVRGQFVARGEYILTGTYHPAALLRDDRLKVDAWRDLQAIAQRINAWRAEHES